MKKEAVKTSGKLKKEKDEKKQPMLPGTPKPSLAHLDPAQKKAVDIIEANNLIKEGHQQRKVACDALANVLSSMGRDRTSVMGKTFMLVEQQKETKIKIVNFSKEKKKDAEE